MKLSKSVFLVDGIPFVIPPSFWHPLRGPRLLGWFACAVTRLIRSCPSFYRHLWHLYYVGQVLPPLAIWTPPLDVMSLGDHAQGAIQKRAQHWLWVLIATSGSHL